MLKGKQIRTFVYPNVYPKIYKMSSVKIVLRKDKMNKNGTLPIHFRIIANRKIKYIASSISVKLEQWNEEESKVIKIQNAARMNAYLQRPHHRPGAVGQVNQPRRGVVPAALRHQPG